MSPLTKAFVVLVTLLSILLVTLVVPFVAQVDSLTAERNAAKDQAKASEATIDQLRADLVTARETIAAKDTAQNTSQNQLESKVQELAGQNTSLQAQLAQSKADAQSMQATLEALSVNDQTKTQLLEDYVASIANLQAKLVGRTTENTELVDRNNALENQVGQLTRSVNRLREANIALAEAAAGGGVAAGAGAQSPVPAGGEPIYGKITAMKQVPGGKSLVQINLGTSDGIVPRQRFVAYRGKDELIGTLEVKSVDESVAVAVVVSEQKPVQSGDFVVSSLGL